MRKIAIPLEITEISAEILAVVRHLFGPGEAELTLLTVARPRLGSIYVAEGHMMPMNSSAFLEEESNEAWQAYYAELQKKLETAARRLHDEGYTVHTHLLTGNIITEIANYVDGGAFDLLAMATFGRKGLSRLIYGSVAEELLRATTTPMLLTRHHAEPSTNVASTKLPAKETPIEAKTAHEPTSHVTSTTHQLTIAAATDGTAHSQNALRAAADLAHTLAATLTILISVRGRDGVAHNQQIMAVTRELLADIEPQPELIPVVGPTAEALGLYLDTKPADLLVIGAFRDRGSGGPANIGITAQRIVQYAPMPVLIFKGHHSVIKRVLAYVAYGDQAVIESALRLSRALKAQLHFLHVLPASAEVKAKLLQPEDPLLTKLAHDAPLATFMRTMQARLHDEGLPSDALQMWSGEVNKVIQEVGAQGHFDLIMIGAHANAGYFPNSLADYVTRYAPMSVFIVR